MDFFSIASGSSGNCICVGDDTTHVMIDAGISGKRIEAGMNKYDYTTADMAGLLVTHEHSDHVSGLGVISRKYHIPIYGTAATIRAIRSMKSLGAIDDTLFHVIKPDEDFSIGSLNIHPFRISHDAADPVAYRIENAKYKVAVCTDLGYYDGYIVENLTGLDAMLLEANHDIHMLEVGSYPYPLKQRILGDHGHLSNEASGKLLSKVLNDDIKHVFLGHLSHENNYPDLAYETVRLEVTMDENTPYNASDFNITVASRSDVSERVVL
ncbi:MBL fold metallo-hydrolase [Pseudobutyrivibrio xylanivorans]|uniref:MBL fold metallo-hydrolase n=1 Tax=Pseudobutyrivibrio xylanivorans TaxID=185007 RepID=A0A5P6VRP1_PSEXY|nr:MBL fold metallo-hydrolase [Pseudobutyrivibrio xylanivorans]QFJ55130.1 MBL fold metallo-hydrolase [Pseudobutyrivibrio xylanivorans]